MNDKRLMTTGIVGTVLTALCCFTPVLIVLLTRVGLSAAIGYLDIVLLPALAVFMAITLYAFWRQRSSKTTVR
ncbi:MAG: mercury resistance system transport protein MerF [Granulosicoccus sp.]